MGATPLRVGKLRGLPLIGQWEHAATNGVFERQQPRGSKMDVPGFDGLGDAFDGNPTVGLILQRLRLDAAENGGSALFVAIWVGFLPDQGFVAAPAMSPPRRQISL